MVLGRHANPKRGEKALFSGSIKALAPSVPVILITGFGDIMEATDGQPVGVDLILTKPVSMAVLRETLAEFTAQPEETPVGPH